MLWTFHAIKFKTVRFDTGLCTIDRTHSRTSTTSSEEVTYTFQGRQSPHSPPRGYSSYLPDSQLPESDKTPMRRGKKVHVLLDNYLTIFSYIICTIIQSIKASVAPSCTLSTWSVLQSLFHQTFIEVQTKSIT